MTRWRARIVFISGMALLSGWAVAGAKTPDKLQEMQAKFDRETNAVHKAKFLEKLGDAQFEETRRASKAQEYGNVALVFEKYRDNARAALAGLKKLHRDAERQSGGYRQLEINVRRSIREVKESLLIVPEDYRPPLEIVQKDLSAIDDELIGMLFRNHHPQKTESPLEEK